MSPLRITTRLQYLPTGPRSFTYRPKFLKHYMSPTLIFSSSFIVVVSESASKGTSVAGVTVSTTEKQKHLTSFRHVNDA